jgi:hypothetical protein
MTPIPTNSATILGNGNSRTHFDLDYFRKQGPLYGCNGIYRSEKINWLVAIDDKMIKEILSDRLPQYNFFVPPLHKRFEPAEYSPVRRCQNAGMVAMELAIDHGYSQLFCLGFDFLFDDSIMNMGNVFDGTHGYGPETRATVNDCVNRIKYLSWFAKKHKHVSFIFVYPKQYEENTFRYVDADNVKISFV